MADREYGHWLGAICKVWTGIRLVSLAPGLTSSDPRGPDPNAPGGHSWEKYFCNHFKTALASFDPRGPDSNVPVFNCTREHKVEKVAQKLRFFPLKSIFAILLKPVIFAKALKNINLFAMQKKYNF